MNFDADFESMGRRRATSAPGVDDAASPEDLLFAVPDSAEDSSIRNPYENEDSSHGFDDGSIGSVGPLSFESGALVSPDTPADNANEDSGLHNLFLEKDEAASAGSFGGAFDTGSYSVEEVELDADVGAMPGLMGSSHDLQEPSRVEEDFGTVGDYRPLLEDSDDVGLGASPVAAGLGASAARPPAVGSARGKIPGRVSYSQQSGGGSTTPSAKREYRPAADQFQSPGAMASSSPSMLWLLPFTAFLGGASFAAYYFMQMGSPVLAGVSFGVGALAALFCRVLFRR